METMYTFLRLPLRLLMPLLLLVGVGSSAWTATVNVVAIAPYASELNLAPGQLLFTRTDTR